MRVLIVEDDFGSRRYLQVLLRGVCDTDVVVDGREGVEAYRLSWEERNQYDLILLDIMMPEMDGHTALKEIRRFEAEIGVLFADRVKVVMTTALEDPRNVVEAYHDGEADAYLVKPIEREKLLATIASLGLSW